MSLEHIKPIIKHTVKKLNISCSQCGKNHSMRVPCCIAKEKPFELTADKQLPPKEWQEQRLLFDHAKSKEAEDPRWALLAASMNGLRSTPGAVAMAKLCGLKRGYPDTNLLVQGYAACPGMLVEVKRKHKNWTPWSWECCATEDQKWWRDRLREQGFRVELAHGAEEAIALYASYLGATR